VKRIRHKGEATDPGNGTGTAAASVDDGVAEVISERLKSLRNRAGLSLERLSKLAGVSRAMLSQIELGRSVPTITVLSRIAVAFEVPVSIFLAPEPGDRVHVMRRDEAQELRSTDGKYVSRALFPFLGERKTEFYELRLEPACSQESAAHAGGTTENLVVAQGAMSVAVAGDQFDLTAGDSIYFAADLPHSYRNSGNSPALAYLVVSYSQPVNY
jgi:transcriptional regulator with XRE-family HTH domain